VCLYMYCRGRRTIKSLSVSAQALPLVFTADSYHVPRHHQCKSTTLLFTDPVPAAQRLATHGKRTLELVSNSITQTKSSKLAGCDGRAAVR
jgi:hypothetical protein